MGMIKTAFISLLVRRRRGALPGAAAGCDHDEEIMGSGEACGDWEQPFEKLEAQWTQFMSGAFRAIVAEEMRLRCEELRRQMGPYN